MMRPPKFQNGRFLLAALTMISLSILVFISDEVSAKNTSQQEAQNYNSQYAVLFEGFEPNSEVYYSILSATDVMAEGFAITNDAGNLIVNYKPSVDSNASHYVYDFKISRNGDFANILIRQNLESGNITITGNGLDKFSEVSLITPEKSSKTKTDWAGGIFGTEKLQTDKESNYQIALHGFSSMGALGKRQNPAIIKVLAAPGGGLFTNTPNDIGSMTPSQPSSGIWPLSTSAANLNASFPGYTQAIVNNYIRAFMLMTEQLNVAVMQQTFAIGQFFDAKIQLEAQRTHQHLKAEAVKDYHPSEQLCRYGSYVRSLAKTERKSVADKFVLNDALMERYKNLTYNSASTVQTDLESRLKQYREIYCNPKDNDNKLDYLCEHDQDETLAGGDSTFGAAVPDGIGGIQGTVTYNPNGAGNVDIYTTRLNKDIDFTRTMDFPHTLDMDMTDGVDAADEQDVLALAKNLYWPTPLKQPQDDDQLNDQKVGYLEAQRVIALKNVAHNSYTNLAALKARSIPAPAAPGGGGAVVEPGWTYMKTLMRDFGITDLEIEQLIGVQPSYWAQMEVLTKKIYQLPNFYTNLYDKPVNIDRISVTLDAIKLMQMRDYYTSVQRREMLNSAMLETELVRGNHYSRPESDLLFGIAPYEPY